MKLVIILLCLFSERYLVHRFSFKRFYWFETYYNAFFQKFHGNLLKNSWLVLGGLLLIPVSISLIFYYSIYGIFFGFLSFILNLVLFYYCLGPQNVFYPLTQPIMDSNDALLGSYFFSVNRQLFSVIFWYLVAGPIAIFAYRLLTLCIAIPATKIQSNEVVDILEWIPVRITAFIFLLVGNFHSGFKILLSHLFAKPDFNYLILQKIGIAALQTTTHNEINLIHAEQLVDRTIIVILAIIALFTLFFWA